MSEPVGLVARQPAQRRTVPRAAAFWLLAAVLFLLFIASAAPSPLYRVYQAQWRFSATTLTVIFAVYALVLLITLLLFGSLSDYLGRRRVIAVGLALAAAACGLFLVADGPGVLLAARAVQGVAVGVATGALGAALIDLQPAGSGRGPLASSAVPGAGLAVGALGTSALVQYAPDPTHLVWWVLLGAFLAGIGVVLVLPEPATTRPGVLHSLRPRVGVPRDARGVFAIAVPCIVAVWALGGLYLSLGPSLAVELTASPDLLWGGLVIFLLSGTGAAAATAFRSAVPATAMLTGCLFLLAGVAVTLAGIATTTAAAFLAGTAVAGVGFGVAFLGAFRSTVEMAAPGDRAGLIAAVYIVSYLAFSIPAVIAGAATARFGLHDTAVVYSAAIVALVAAAAGSFVIRRRAPRAQPRPALQPCDPPPGPCTAPPCAPAVRSAAATVSADRPRPAPGPGSR